LMMVAVLIVHLVVLARRGVATHKQQRRNDKSGKNSQFIVRFPSGKSVKVVHFVLILSFFDLRWVVVNSEDGCLGFRRLSASDSSKPTRSVAFTSCKRSSQSCNKFRKISRMASRSRNRVSTASSLAAARWRT